MKYIELIRNLLIIVGIPLCIYLLQRARKEL